MSSRKNIAPYIVAAIAAVVVGLLVWWVVKLEKRLHVEPEPVVVTDTIVDWQYDTVYRYDTRIVKLPIHDTTVCVDSIYATDSVYVEVPIYRYGYDTTLTTEHSSTRLEVKLSGYDVNIDTLTATTTVTPIYIQEKTPWYKRFRPSVGIGVGTTFKGEATVGAYFGVGYLF